jgi:cellulose synthase/poly-beta-1,6-N-acetylglucosamine synthase-like glycosyltransferase
MEVIFWLSVFGVLYPYIGYPIVLSILARGREDGPADGSVLPSVSMIIPVHNEERRIERKLANTSALAYPADRLEVIFVADGCTDRTISVINSHRTAGMDVVELPIRGGKAAALNAGLARARNDIIVFSDASIELAADALCKIVRGFADRRIGCVSGEDRIADAGGEGLYGRYELWLRRLESRVHSIVGASGSFYAQRRAICQPFTEGMAPDLLSVLRTVEQGYRAVSDQSAVGAMTSLKDPKEEFERKVRTLIRGMTTVFAHRGLLNPQHFGVFAFSLWSHKVLRWTVPVFLGAAFISPLALLDSPWYASMFALQLGFYVLAGAALGQWGNLHLSRAGQIALYFSSVHAAMLTAWFRYGMGVRQELWTPSRR